MSETGLDLMGDAGDRIGYYVVDLEDGCGEGAQGPYSADEATLLMGDHQKVVTAAELSAMRGPPESPAPLVLAPPYLPALQKATRSWGRSLLILGVLHFIMGGFLSAPWGVLLILVGLASFIFQSSALFVLYAVTLAWAAVSNALSGEIGWIAFGLLQVYWAVSLFRRFRLFRQAEREALEALGIQGFWDPAARVFPWAGALVGALSLVVFVGAFILVVLLAASSREPTSWDTFDFILGLALNGAVLGFALGLASLLCRHPLKVMSVVGIIAGVLTVMLRIGIRLL